LKKIIITIDGPAASGKGKIANYISKKWNLKHLDSGILYRRIAFNLLQNRINLESIKDIKKNINNQKNLSFKKNKKIRSEKISNAASKIAVLSFVRNYVNKFQKEFVKRGIKEKGFVIDGRDIGSVVFKKADLKLYIDVNEENRAKRRYKQLIDTGEKSIYRTLLKEIKLRDNIDKTRKVSPLVVPKGSYIIDNNGTFSKTTKQINNLIKAL
tara:strand:- start:210 stop:845 length:636 start_codon:yes stop_codon:yes gene_type:complete